MHQVVLAFIYSSTRILLSVIDLKRLKVKVSFDKKRILIFF